MNGNFRVLSHTAVQQTFQFFQNNNFFGPSPAIANVTGDAKLEMFIPSKNGRLYGIDNVGNEEYWAFHPYSQRTLFGELGVKF